MRIVLRPVDLMKRQSFKQMHHSVILKVYWSIMYQTKYQMTNQSRKQKLLSLWRIMGRYHEYSYWKHYILLSTLKRQNLNIRSNKGQFLLQTFQWLIQAALLVQLHYMYRCVSYRNRRAASLGETVDLIERNGLFIAVV